MGSKSWRLWSAFPRRERPYQDWGCQEVEEIHLEAQTGGTALMQRPGVSMGCWALGEQQGGQKAGGYQQVGADEVCLSAIVSTVSSSSQKWER